MIQDFLIALVIVFLVSLLISFITVFLMKRAMNTARNNNSARDYVKRGSFNLRESRDIFLYSVVTKTPRPKNNKR